MDNFKTRLLKFVDKQELSQRGFEEHCGLTQGTIASIRVKGPSVDVLTRISNTYPDLNMNWLVSGNGDMVIGRPKPDKKHIPLLPFTAVAGWLADNNRPDTSFETIVVSDFSGIGANCAIRVEGDSMYPRYKNGDILAIRILHDPSFFQWGRCYVLSTSQGCVVKMLFPDPRDDNKIICHSMNSDNYPDYKILKEDILGVALVVGHAGLE